MNFHYGLHMDTIIACSGACSTSLFLLSSGFDYVMGILFSAALLLRMGKLFYLFSVLDLSRAATRNLMASQRNDAFVSY